MWRATTGRKGGLKPALPLAVAALALIATGYSAAADPALTPEQRSAVDALDVMLAGFDALVEKIDDASYRRDTLQILAGLKARRDVLRSKFEPGFHNDLKLDLNHEYQRTARWLAPLQTPPRSAAPGRDAILATREGQATALVTLDWQIKSLESRNARRPEHDPERVAVKSIRDRHTALQEAFSISGYDALIAEINALGQRRRAGAAKGAGK